MRFCILVLTFLAAAVREASAFALGSSAAVRPAAAAAAAADFAVRMAASADDGSACHLLSFEQERVLRDIIGTDEHGILKPFVECDQPADDPSLTCFLTPDSWVSDAKGHLSSPKYICINNPSPPRAPRVMDFEDSY